MSATCRAEWAKLPLLAGLPQADCDRLLAAAARWRCSKGATIHREGELPDRLHILLRGHVELSKTEGGADCAMMLLNEGDIFSLGAVISGEPLLTTARAISACTLLSIPAAAAREAASASAEVSNRLLALLAGQWRIAVRQILDLKCRNAPQRLAAFLLRLVDEGENGAPVHLPVPKTRLAARVGIAPETLSRNLQMLASEGLTVRGRRVEVRDRARIERFCGHRPAIDGSERMLGVHAL